jgi:hypothetical protein
MAMIDRLTAILALSALVALEVTAVLAALAYDCMQREERE